MSTIFDRLLEATATEGLFASSRRIASKLVSGRAGGLMVETVVAVSLMTITGTAVLSGLSTTHISGAKTERQSVAENIARNQMAYVFSQPYNTTLTWNTGDAYNACPNCEPGSYTVYTDTKHSDPDCDPDSATYDPNKPECDSSNPSYTGDDVQKVVVRVEFDGSKLFELESIKVD